MCILEVGENQEQAKSEFFCGFIKSFNSRRGFGFVSCEETAQRFERDVYLSKDEAMMLADEPAVGLADATATDKKAVPVQEGDFLLFQVKLSTEGFPQAVQAQKIRRLRGKVLQAPCSTADGIIIVSGDDSARAEAASQSPDVALQQLLGAEVKVREAACGQLQLCANDEVAFCCVNTADTNGQAFEAQLLELLSTSRAAGSVLGCFSLKLPCSVGNGFNDSVELHGHALTNRIVLPEVPSDVGVPNLMRLFSKLGGAEPSVSPVRGNRTVGYVSIAFNGPETIAKFLVQATHTISEGGITQLAHMGSCLRRRGSNCACVCECTPATGPLLSDPAPIAFGDVQATPSIDVSNLQDMTLRTECEAMPASPQFFATAGPGVASPQGSNMPVVTNTPAPLVASTSTMSDWRCVHGSIVVAAAAPEVVAAGGNCCSLCIQWPTVIHASAYVVDVLDLRTMASQRFMRGVTESILPALMDLRVDGLSPSSCIACVRCIAPCGCESTCSPWSFLPQAQPVLPPLATTQSMLLLPPPTPSMLLVPPPNAMGAELNLIPQCPPPPAAPPSFSSAVVQETPTATLPAIPEENGDLPGNCNEECLTLD